MSIAPIVSVVIPVFNGEQYIADTLRSVISLGVKRLEIIVVDDGSTDGSGKVAAQFGELVRVVRQANAGPAAARNHGLRLAQAEIVGLLDADDRWTPAVLTAALDLMAADAGVDIVQ